MGFLQLRTIIFGILGTCVTIYLAIWVHWALAILLILVLIPIGLVFIALDVRTYIVHTIALIKNPRLAVAESGVITSQLPFWLKPLGDRIVSKYANGDYDERIAALRSKLKRS